MSEEFFKIVEPLQDSTTEAGEKAFKIVDMLTRAIFDVYTLNEAKDVIITFSMNQLDKKILADIEQWSEHPNLEELIAGDITFKIDTSTKPKTVSVKLSTFPSGEAYSEEISEEPNANNWENIKKKPVGCFLETIARKDYSTMSQENPKGRHEEIYRSLILRLNERYFASYLEIETKPMSLEDGTIIYTMLKKSDDENFEITIDVLKSADDPSHTLIHKYKIIRSQGQQEVNIFTVRTDASKTGLPKLISNLVEKEIPPLDPYDNKGQWERCIAEIHDRIQEALAKSIIKE